MSASEPSAPKHGSGKRPHSTRRGAPVSATSPEEPLVAPAAPTVGDWRTEVVVASSVNIVAGIWLIVAPFIAGYSGADAVWNPIVCGAIVVVFAMVRAYQPVLRTIGLSAGNALVGAWLFASGFWLAESAAASTVGWITGFVVFFLAVLSGASSMQSRSSLM